MKILVINTGSSSIKYQLFDMDDEAVLATGMLERIGEDSGKLTHITLSREGTRTKKVMEGHYPDHGQGLETITALLTDPECGVIRDKSEIFAVGHRVVHGGETFQAPGIIDDAVILEIQKNTPLAPLHNPPNLTGIRTARSIFPESPQVAVFDTAFHQTIPKKAYIYALPYDLYERHRVRRYGFHGTSHAYVAEKTAEYLNQPPGELNLITLHLGNGASMAAIQNGQCVDTSMGLTPLEGLVMGTRSGDMDPAIPFFLANHLNLSLTDIDGILNKESGLKGICGANDMRVVLERAAKGDDLAGLALEVYTYRIKKYIGAYAAVLGRLDALVFTGGIGENAPAVRERCCEGLSCLNIKIDPGKNHQPHDRPRQISPPEAGVKVLVVPTNEELKIARETLKVVMGEASMS
ncbi:MAG: acetate kinase [Desulfobacteraceae bacterium]|nr:acetate kinase [Desulfobacteraceae bacterium]